MADLPTNTQPPAGNDLVNEHLLIEQLGIPLKKIRAMRPEGVQVQPDGVFWPLWLAHALADSVQGTLTLPEKNAAADGIEELTVSSIARGSDGRHFPNPSVIHARRTNGDIVVVRVVSSSKYRPTLRIGGQPMTFKARKADGNWWVLVGREPRYPGQW
jgi:hypothetical protein